ncbi:hypothetical protein ACQJBY_047339 [Aegilops geniculata]
MYDFFFTKYATIYYGSMAATIWSMISVIGISIMAYFTARAPLKISQGDRQISSTVTDDVVITLVILGSTALLEFLQMLFFWMGIWGRVSFACKYIREQSRLKGTTSQRFLAKIGVCLASSIMVLKEFLANIGVSYASNRHYWQHKIGQYSLLDSVSCNPSRSILAILRDDRLLQIVVRMMYRLLQIVVRMMYIHDNAFCHPINSQALKVRRKAGKSVELPDEVKKAVISSLKSTGGKVGKWKCLFPPNNEAADLLWACEWVMNPSPSGSQRKQNQTHIILKWHIATWYCEMVPLSPDGPEELKVSLSIATKLSKYCAYLVVSAPKLLPGHHYDTIQKFDEAAVEAVTFLPKSMSMYEAMKSSAVPEETKPKTIFESGVKLGRQLEGMEEGARWKVMADFWAEMILYLAPSANVEEHIEQLAQGGEFITHIWALLSNAGILERQQEHQAGAV